MTLVGKYDYRWTRLICGSNGSGFSSMLNVFQINKIGNASLFQSVLFNCGDSTQLACLQKKVKLQKLVIILFTSLAPHNTGGLPGIILCLSDLVGKIYDICQISQFL